MSFRLQSQGRARQVKDTFHLNSIYIQFQTVYFSAFVSLFLLYMYPFMHGKNINKQFYSLCVM